MPVIPVRRWSGAVGALVLATVAIVAPAGPARAAVGCAVDYTATIGSHTGVNTPPTNWRVNGVACVTDGEPPTVIADPTSDSVPEGTGAGFRVRLSHPPAEAAYLGMTMRGTGGWVSQPVMLRFTPTNWSSWQGFAVGSVQDANTVDDVVVFTLSFPGYLSDTVTFTQIDDD
ncbi:hypothetical protein [Plantactinospora sonchi]|uniref:Secreted protein n=1 Tax=Plantactinospora sonchi TaxID=1544735 RepID=A0ABU7S554_9ACTN